MNQEPKNDNERRPVRRFNYWFLILTIFIIIGIGFFIYRIIASNSYVEFNATEFEQNFNAGTIETMESKPLDGYQFQVTGKFIQGGKRYSYKVVLLYDQMVEYADKAVNNSISYTANEVDNNTFWTVLLQLVPYVIMGFIMIMLFRGATNSNSQAFEFGKNRANLMREKTKKFSDVAGCDEEKYELSEIVDFLKNPKKYTRLGARIPRGVLLVGPPGTGKTLLAKAVAGEASVPFFSISGSDFVEMFVGVGASRVRDLFKVAKENSPCIIFIDEIDAVGRQRGAGMGGGHDEREQTLNQILVEMDGFSNNQGIIIIAATNRPDVLDPALLRPGRFDRQITIDIPDVKGREAILKVHSRGKFFEDGIDFGQVAERIPGFSGADIENLLNEAAILVARDNREKITVQDLDEAMDRVMMGPAKRSRTYTAEEKRRIAFHESGHAVIGLKLENAVQVQKVTIIARGQAGGYNLLSPKEETFTHTKRQLLETITGYLGGRVAEEIMFNEMSTGAYDDIKRATGIARAMVAEYGMSELGPIQYESNSGSVFLGRDYLKDKNFSDTIAHEIDQQVRKIIFECQEQARQVITENIDLLKNLAEYLIKVETLTKADIEEITNTGKLAWYEEKLIKDEEAKKAKELAEKQESIYKNDDEAEVVITSSSDEAKTDETASDSQKSIYDDIDETHINEDEKQDESSNEASGE